MDRPRDFLPRRRSTLLLSGGLVGVALALTTFCVPSVLARVPAEPPPPSPEAAGSQETDTSPKPAEPKPAQTEPVQAEPAEEAAEASPADRPRGLTGIWWNRPRFVQALTLDTEQRKAMDELLRASMAERRQHQQRLRKAQQEFYRAAVDGDRLTAGQALGELAESTAALQRFEGQLKLQVLAQLRAEQRRQLAESFPMLLQRPWVVTRGVRRDFRRSP